MLHLRATVLAGRWPLSAQTALVFDEVMADHICLAQIACGGSVLAVLFKVFNGIRVWSCPCATSLPKSRAADVEFSDDVPQRLVGLLQVW